MNESKCPSGHEMYFWFKINAQLKMFYCRTCRKEYEVKVEA